MATLALAIALLALLGGAIWWAVDTLTRGGTSDLPVSTWIFMIGGAIVAIGIGVGLMALVFWSNRRGHDDDVFHSGDDPRLNGSPEDEEKSEGRD